MKNIVNKYGKNQPRPISNYPINSKKKEINKYYLIVLIILLSIALYLLIGGII